MAASRAPTILLVEDEPDVLQSIVDVLQASIPRARVLHAASAEEGLGLLAQPDIDVVVSDYRLPGMDGLAFLAEAHRRQPHAPRLLITAYAELEVAEAAVAAARIEAVVMKPLDVESFVAHIHAALEACAPAASDRNRPPGAQRAGAALTRRYVRDA